MTGHPVRQSGARRLIALALCPWALATVAQAQATAKPPSGIYTCVDEKGRRITADRPIAECTDREQQVLNRDGSLRTVLPPTLTAEERAQREARDRAAAEARAAQADAVRRDRNLMARYPNEAAHSRAREAALDTVRLAMKATEIRLRQLAAEAVPLRDEAEFYEGRSLPASLKSAIDANEVAVEAQRSASTNQAAELDRINRLYDAELDRLRRLWAGVVPGSLGPLAANGAGADGAARDAAAKP
ncbi:MAG TPA: hypothetical protein VK876_07575 [Rubrivivax sp.]|nr:hypothetical protein [Rubrivivax sp.]